jgi:predicted small lipoprotein YifL
MTWGIRILAAVFGLMLLSGCGSKGHSANPPSDLAATAGDSRVTLTWTMASGSDYWIFYAPATSISVDNWTSLPGAKAIQNVSSPLIVSGLINGTTYAFTMDARVNNGPGGSGSPSITAVPRMAGSTWTVGTAIGTGNLNAVTNGTVGATKTGGTIFMAAGAGGKIASSQDGATWTTLTSNTAVDLNAITFGGATYVAAGAGGAIVYSSDGTTWAAETSATTNNLYGLASNGASLIVGVGATGTIVYSSNGGANWATAVSGTTNDLLAVAYGNGRYVAVGSGGTLLTSTDAVNWTVSTSTTSLDLKSVTYGTNATTSTTLFVAVGASGALVASTDGVTWTAYGSLPVTSVNGITYGSQFVLVGDAGIIYTSTTGTSWQVQSSGASNNLKAVTHSPAGYSTVGAIGTNLLSL